MIIRTFNGATDFVILCVHLSLGFYSDVPSYEFEEKYNKFSFTSLLTIPDVFNAISKVKAECNKVAVMSLFQVPITKCMRLEEFEQAQSQATAQVPIY